MDADLGALEDAMEKSLAQMAPGCAPFILFCVLLSYSRTIAHSLFLLSLLFPLSLHTRHFTPFARPEREALRAFLEDSYSDRYLDSDYSFAFEHDKDAGKSAEKQPKKVVTTIVQADAVSIIAAPPLPPPQAGSASKPTIAKGRKVLTARAGSFKSAGGAGWAGQAGGLGLGGGPASAGYLNDDGVHVKGSFMDAVAEWRGASATGGESAGAGAGGRPIIPDVLYEGSPPAGGSDKAGSVRIVRSGFGGRELEGAKATVVGDASGAGGVAVPRSATSPSSSVTSSGLQGLQGSRGGAGRPGGAGGAGRPAGAAGAAGAGGAQGTAGGGSLLDGEYDEKQNAQSFQQALLDWRAKGKGLPGKKAPSMSSW
jgi:hypothetical protein